MTDDIKTTEEAIKFLKEIEERLTADEREIQEEEATASMAEELLQEDFEARDKEADREIEEIINEVDEAARELADYIDQQPE